VRRVLNFASPREHYVADAAVVWCFDFRFDAAFRKLLKRIGVLSPDAVRVAGGAKSLASPQQESEREFILDQVRKSIRLHKTRTAVLMLHSDCGAYGGLAAFDGDTRKEAQHHAADLQRAATFLKQQIPELTVKAYFVDFVGVWEVETSGAADIGSARSSSGGA
jgi:hypothetical protein